MRSRRILAWGLGALFLGLAGPAAAATSVAWTSPANGTHYPVDSVVDLQGQASAFGTVGGTGLDLAIVMDSTGSMTLTSTVNGVTKTRAQWQKDFAAQIVNSLPMATTSVTIIEFDTDANTVRTLTQLTSDNSAIISAINSVDSSGNTSIGSGINRAYSELTSSRASATRQQMMIVFSDGENNAAPTPESPANTAHANGIEAIHAVGLPGHSVAGMRSIADGPDNIYGNADDNGTYVNGTNLQVLIDLFNGTGGSLVGLDHVTVTFPNGTTSNVATDFLGNFTVPSQMIALGAQSWVATAYGTDGTTASATLTLYGDGQTVGVVPEPNTMLLLGSGLMGLSALRRRQKR